jgi:Methyltransferase domain
VASTYNGGRVKYLYFLRQVHETLQPESYLEIGVRRGRSLARSSVPSIGVDPAYDIAPDLTFGDEVTLARHTSDDFFALDAPLASLPNERIDLSFIDGMHLYEFALRDFMNIERFSRPGSVIVFDDVLPRNSLESQRDRETSAWTGDVWKIIPTLHKLRPDLMTIQVGTRPTGLLMVLGADAGSTVLQSHYEELLTSWAGPDHVEPPAALVKRRRAVAPEVVLAAPFWDVLRQLRAGAATPQDLREAVKAWSAGELRPAQAEAVNRSFKPAPIHPAATRPGATRRPMTARRIVRGVRRRVAKLAGSGTS